MILDWLKHIKDPTQREDFAKTVKNSTVVINRLKDMVEDYEKELSKQELSLDTYDTPSWAYKQAHINGRRQELQRIKLLLTM